jgi:hypothetical protein
MIDLGIGVNLLLLASLTSFIGTPFVTLIVGLVYD